MHRLIVTSATYRQSSQARPDLTDVDPDNRLLARQSRLRLDAEIVRDVGAGGQRAAHAEGRRPERLPAAARRRHDASARCSASGRPSTGPDRYRRGLYTFFWRATPHPALTVFDAPDADQACTRRIRSNTPLQALTLLNDEAFVEFAQAPGRPRAASRRRPTTPGRIRHAFRLCLARRAAPEREALTRCSASWLASRSGRA